MKTILLPLVLLGLLTISCQETKTMQTEGQSEGKEVVITPVFYPSHEPNKQQVPFSDVVQVGDTYYLAGQIGMDHRSRTLVAGGIQSETAQAIDNIEAVLKHHQLNLSDVVKATVILSDINDFSAFNEIYVSKFPQKPARTTFAASGLARNAKIEIEVIAVRTIVED